MPAYDYDCAACGRRFEVIHGLDAERPTVCPLCGKGPIRKAISAPAIHYRGSGWAKKERRATATSGASKASGEGSSAGEGNAKAAEGSAKVEGGSTDATKDAPTTPATKSAEAGAAKSTD